MMIVNVPLSAFFMLMSGFCFSSLIASCSFVGRLFLGLDICFFASCVLTSSRYISSATDDGMSGSQFDFTWKGCGFLSLQWKINCRHICIAKVAKSFKGTLFT